MYEYNLVFKLLDDIVFNLALNNDFKSRDRALMIMTLKGFRETLQKGIEKELAEVGEAIEKDMKKNG